MKKQGLPMCGLDVKIIGEDGGEIAPGTGESGEVFVRGPWIATSYFDNPESTGNFTDDGFWKSGDAGFIDENRYLKLTDRFKDIIKSGGEWISSVDLENEIMDHPDVSEAAVVGIEHPQWQERPLALVVMKPNAGKVTKEEIHEAIGNRFAKWQLPDEVLFVDKIPKTRVGKVSKKDIRQKYGDYYSK